MATITSVGTGLWSEASTWNAGVPANNDVVIIAAGHTVNFNVDQSGFADGIDGITITGQLSLYRSGGPYYMKIKAAKTIAGAGTFDCGTLASPIPFAVKHTITGGAGWYINGAAGLTMTVYAYEPTIKTILLSGDEAIGQTELSVDTDVTGDIWVAGDTIRIDDINKAAESEERVIAAGGIAAGAITVTVGLTAAKSTGAVVSLITRNVKFLGLGGSIAKNFSSSGKVTVAGGWWAAASAQAVFETCNYITISGGAFENATGNAYILNVGIIGGSVISGGVFAGFYALAAGQSNLIISGGYFSGCSTNIVQTSNGTSISGGIFKGNKWILNGNTGASISGGTFYGNTNIAYYCAGLNISGGTFDSNAAPIISSSATIKSATFLNNTYDIQSSVVTAFNVSFGSTTENYLYATLTKESYSESIDHDATAGAFRSWTKGGVTTKQATTYPTGYTSSYQTVLENASVEGFWQKEITVGAGASVNVTMWLRKTASMTYLPRIQVFLKSGTDPFAGGTPLKTFTMTDTTDTWESDLYTYTNSTSEDVTLVLRAQGMNASGSMYSVMDVEQINVDMTTALAQLALILADTGTDIPASIAALPTAASILGSEIETGYDLKEVLQIVASAIAGKASGGGTTTITFRDLNDTANRIVEVVDDSGNRTSVTLTTAS